MTDRHLYLSHAALVQAADKRSAARRSVRAPKDRAIRHSSLYRSATLAHYSVALACLSLVTLIA